MWFHSLLSMLFGVWMKSSGTAQLLLLRWEKAQTSNMLFLLEEANNINIKFIVIIKSIYLK